MNLLLILSALLTGLTGVMTGERKAEQAQMQRSASEAAIGAVAEAVAERILPSRFAAVQTSLALADQARPPLFWSVQTIAVAQTARPLNEKRQE